MRLFANPGLTLIDKPWDWKSKFFSPETVAFLLPLLASSDDNLVLATLDLLYTHRVDGAVPAIVKAIRRKKCLPTTRDKLIKLLGAEDLKAVVTAFKETELRQFLVHADPGVVMVAEGSLVSSGDRQYLESLFAKFKANDAMYSGITAILRQVLDGSNAQECYDIYRSKTSDTALSLIQAIIERDGAKVPIEVLRAMTNLPSSFRRTNTYSRFTDVDRDMSPHSYEECFTEWTVTEEIPINTTLIELARAEIRRREIQSSPVLAPQKPTAPPEPVRPAALMTSKERNKKKKRKR